MDIVIFVQILWFLSILIRLFIGCTAFFRLYISWDVVDCEDCWIFGWAFIVMVYPPIVVGIPMSSHFSLISLRDSFVGVGICGSVKCFPNRMNFSWTLWYGSRLMFLMWFKVCIYDMNSVMFSLVSVISGMMANRIDVGIFFSLARVRFFFMVLLDTPVYFWWSVSFSIFRS